MNLKKCLIAATLAAGAMASPAFAGLSVNVGIGIPVAPPAAVYEAPPPPPPPAYGYVWAPGYWAWSYNRYIWVRGRYIAPRPGYVWAPEHWDHRGDRYHFVAGDWHRDPHWNNGRGHHH